MKIALISMNTRSRGYLPFAIACLAGSLRENDHEVRLYDASLEKEESFVRQIEAFSPHVVGLSFMTPYAHIAKRVARRLKKEGRYIVAGGPHATALPEDVLKDQSIDCVVRGEGEVTFEQLLRQIEKRRDLSSILGVSHRNEHGRIEHNQPQIEIEDLDSLPSPAYDLLDMKAYIRGFEMNPQLGFKGTTLFVSRGCPYQCIFCQPVFGRRPRYRSAHRIIDEMVMLKERYRLNGFNFSDDSFTLEKQWTYEFCEKKIKAGQLRGIIWSCNSRVDGVDEELLKMMFRAGCRGIWYGIESGCQESLDRMKKRITLEQIQNACRWTRKVGMGLKINIIVGFPWEDKQMIYRTADFARSLRPDQIQFSCAMPYPGTELYQICAEEGVDLRGQFHRLLYSEHALVPTKTLTIPELNVIQKDILKKLFLNPRYVYACVFRNLHSFRQLVGYMIKFKEKILSQDPYRA